LRTLADTRYAMAAQEGQAPQPVAFTAGLGPKPWARRSATNSRPAH
jgi:hypothetical protein